MITWAKNPMALTPHSNVSLAIQFVRSIPQIQSNRGEKLKKNYSKQPVISLRGNHIWVHLKFTGNKGQWTKLKIHHNDNNLQNPDWEKLRTNDPISSKETVKGRGNPKKHEGRNYNIAKTCDNSNQRTLFGSEFNSIQILKNNNKEQLEFFFFSICPY